MTDLVQRLTSTDLAKCNFEILVNVKPKSPHDSILDMLVIAPLLDLEKERMNLATWWANKSRLSENPKKEGAI